MKKRLLSFFTIVISFFMSMHIVSALDLNLLGDSINNTTYSIELYDQEIKLENDIQEHSNFGIQLFTNEVISSKINEVSLKYESATDIMKQYITKDKRKAKLINNNQLYSYDIESDTISLEYTFPTATYSSNSSSGVIYGSKSKVKVYIDEAKGLMYYAYNSYTNVTADSQIIVVIVYDLENSKITTTVKHKGHTLSSVGADTLGNIYIGTDEIEQELSYLYILSPTGSTLAKRKLTYPINDFSGFCDDGTFYFVEEYMAYSAYGYANLMGRLNRGTFKNNTIKINADGYDYVKNIYFSDYNTPVEILNNKYLVTFTGIFYSLNDITDTSLPSETLYTAKNLEKGSKYHFVYNSGVNSIMDIENNQVYTLNDNNSILLYSLSSGKKLKIYTTTKKIFNIKDGGNFILALETDGTNFYYEKIMKSNFTSITTTVYNMNEFKAYKGRTKNDIIRKFISLTPNNYSSKLFDSKSKEKSPYKESILTAKTKNNALKLSNYYRWLAGLTILNSASDETWSNAGKGAVLLAASEFSHTPAQPSDMSDEFYKSAYQGTSNSNIAYNYYQNQYKLHDSIRQFLNDNGYTIPGHRNTFFTRNATNIAYGISSIYLTQTVEYTDDPNPQGTATINNNDAAYAWPTPGYFPAEDISTSAYWTVNLNTDKINLSNIPLVVTITDLDTKQTFERSSSANGLYSTTFWGRYISFAPPTVEGNSYAGKNYKITLTNLTDEKGLPATLEYTINFFSYEGTYTIDNVTYNVNKYGKIVESITDKNIKLSDTSFEYTGTNIEPKVTIDGLTEGTDFYVTYTDNKNAGTATVTITGIGNYQGTITKTFTISLAKPKVTILNTNVGPYMYWKRVAGAKGYYIYRNGEKIATTKDLSYTDTTATVGNMYKYKVVAYVNKAITTPSPIRTTYFFKSPNITTFKSTRTGITVGWDKVAASSGYEIEYSTSSTFDSESTSKMIIERKSKIQKKLTDILPNKVYYVRMRTYKTVDSITYYSEYSPVKSIKSKIEN